MANPDDLPDPEQEVAWIQTPFHAPVLDASGGAFATTESLLGDEASDIFHGLAVKLEEGGRIAELSADQVTKITRSAVHSSVDGAQTALLPDYQEEKWFHLGWGGLFRHRPEWEDR